MHMNAEAELRHRAHACEYMRVVTPIAHNEPAQSTAVRTITAAALPQKGQGLSVECVQRRPAQSKYYFCATASEHNRPLHVDGMPAARAQHGPGTCAAQAAQSRTSNPRKQWRERQQILAIS